MFFFNKKDKKDESLFTQAINAYKDSRYNDAYNLIKEASEVDNTGRALFCLGLLSINYNCVPRDQQDINVFADYMSKAMEKGKDAPYGLVAYALDCSGQHDMLLDFIDNNLDDVNDGLFNLYVAKAYMGMFSDDKKYTDFEITKKAIGKAIDNAEETYKDYQKGNEEEIEYSLYSEFDKSINLSNILGLTYWACARFMFLYEDSFSKDNFLAMIETSFKYLNNDGDIFTAYYLYLIAIYNNYFGLSDLELANDIIGKMDALYLSFDDNDSKNYESQYDYLWDQYNKFYEKESQRLRERNIHFSDIDDHNDLNIKNVGKAIMDWANTPSSEETTTKYYIIDGRKYTKGDFNYLYDELGNKTNIIVDELERVRDENYNEIGYFNEKGLFIKSR